MARGAEYVGHAERQVGMKTEVGSRYTVVRARQDRRAEPPAPAKLPRGTRDFLPPPAAGGAVVEHQMGILWSVALRVETMARNLETAGGLEHARRIGRDFPQWDPEDETVSEWE